MSHLDRAKRNGHVPFMAWMRGWRDAAAGQARRPEYFQNADAEVRQHYEDGFTAGRAAVLAASAHASQLFNYTPNILRGADSPANDPTSTTPARPV